MAGDIGCQHIIGNKAMRGNMVKLAIGRQQHGAEEGCVIDKGKAFDGCGREFNTLLHRQCRNVAFQNGQPSFIDGLAGFGNQLIVVSPVSEGHFNPPIDRHGALIQSVTPRLGRFKTVDIGNDVFGIALAPMIDQRGDEVIVAGKVMVKGAGGFAGSLP